MQEITFTWLEDGCSFYYKLRASIEAYVKTIETSGANLLFLKNYDIINIERMRKEVKR